MARTNPTIKPGATGATTVRKGKDIQRIEGPAYNGQTASNIRAGAKIAASGNKSKPYAFKPSDTPSASGTKAFKNSSNKSLKKAQRRVK